MKKVLYILGFLLILCLIVCPFILIKGWQTNDGQTIITVIDTVVIPGDSIPYQVYVNVPVPVFIDRFPDTGKTIIDTAAILAKYYERAYYNDTIRDTSMLVILREEVTQNRIVCRDVKFQNLRSHSIIYNTTKIEPSPQWLAGISGNVIGGRIGIGAGVTYVRKRDAISATIYTNGAQAAYFWRIR